MSSGQSSVEWSDEELFRAASQGDAQAFVLLQPRLLHIQKFLELLCVSHSIPEQIAYTISHQTLYRACEKVRSRPVPRKRRRKRWLQKIARKEFEVWIQKYQALFRPSYQQRAETRIESHHTPVYSDAVTDRFFDCLIGEQRKILKLRLKHGFDIHKSAYNMNIDIEYAKNLYEEALITLQNYLDNRDQSADYEEPPYDD